MFHTYIIPIVVYNFYMSFKQYDLDKSSVFGFGNVARVYIPYLTGNLRRKNPDMSSTVPYFPALTGTTLIVEQGGDFTGTTTITFTSNGYAQAIADITAAGLGNFIGVDSNGYLSIKSTYSGGQNYLKLTGGTAQAIVGMLAYPSPAGISYAGEIDTAKSNFYEKSVKGEAVALQNDALNRENWNRGLAAVSHILDTVKANQDKEIAIPREFDVSITGTSFTITSDERLYINAANILVSQPSSDQLDNVACILDEYHNQIFDSNGDRVRVTSITYGSLVNQTQSFASWSVADGKQVFGALSHFQKVKATYTIQDVVGNTLRVTGGNAITDKIQPNDTIVISGATNKNPFSHNGEFLVDKVLSSELLQIRPKGDTDFKLFAVETPSAINPIVGLGEVLGTATIYVGKFIPLTMKAAPMYFNLSSSLPAGTYKVRLSIGRTIKELLKEDFSSSDIISPFGGQLEFGSKLLTTLANALKPRIISKPSSITSKTLFAELFNNTTVGAVGTRIYTNSLGGLDIVYNGKWDGATYVKDDVGQDVVRITENGTEIFLGDSTFSILLDHVNNNLTAGSSTNYLEVDHPSGNISANMTSTFDVKDGTYTVFSVPNFDGLVSGQISARQGINLGTGFNTDSQHLVEKINYTCNVAAGKYTLLSETSLIGGRKREYVKEDGTSVLTINAKWNGTNWVKDIILGNAYSGKLEFKSDFLDYKLYKHLDSASPFSDSSWTNYQLPYSFSDLGDCVFNNTKPIFLEEFTAGAESKYLFSSTSSSGSTFAPNTTTDIDCFGAGKYTLTSAGSPWTLSGSAAPLYIGVSDFVMRYRFKIINRANLRPTGNDTFIGANAPGSTTAMSIKIAKDLVNIYYELDLGSVDTGIAFQDDTWYVIEWQRFNGELYLSIDDGLTKTIVFSAMPDAVSRTLKPKYVVEAESVLVFPTDIFLIDYFEVYR